MTQFPYSGGAWNLFKLRNFVAHNYKLVVAIGFICGLIFIENVMEYSSWDSGQHPERNSHISLRGLRSRHTMSISGEDYQQLAPAAADNSYPSKLSCTTKHSTSNHTFIEYIQTTQGKRRDRIRAVCDKCHVSSDYISAKANKLKGSSLLPHCHQLTDIKLKRQMLNHILVDDVHKVLYCAIPKVGCTTFKRIIAKLTGLTGTATGKEIHVHDDDYMEHLGLRYLSRYDVGHIQQRLKHYFKFMIVRHPLERLLSAYRDKFAHVNEHNVYFHSKYGRKIVRKFRRRASRKSLKYGQDVTFPEFIKYIIALENKTDEYNPHWKSYTELCYPAHIHYDFIGKFETLQKDMKYILHQFDPAVCPLHFPELSHKSTSNHLIQTYYNNISHADILKLYDIYKNDFLLYQYVPSTVLL